MGPGADVPEDYFFVNASAASVMLRQKILKKCREDIYNWLNHENGQVAIYDAVNPLKGGRRSLAKEFAKHDVQVRTLFHSLIFGSSANAHPTPDFIPRVICR
jgi:6-phosphofructo-2-kinase/fructose-2,6-biphosphatase 4